MISTGFDYGIRKGLTEKGVNPGNISYDPNRGYVTVGGKDFMKADKVYNGASFTNQQNFNTAWDNYNKPQSVPGASVGETPYSGYSTVYGAARQADGLQPSNYTPPASDFSYLGAYGANANGGNGVNPQATVTPGAAPVVAPSNPAAAQQNDWLTAIIQSVMNPTPINAEQIMGSPEWSAYQAQSQKGANEATRAAQESYGSAGFGRSYALGERAQGIQNDALNYMNTQVLPQLIAQARADQNQQLQNRFGVLDALTSNVNRYDTLNQNAESNAINKGQLTGTYLSPALEALYQGVLTDKGEYAQATTPEERNKQRAEAEAKRAQIRMLGGNTDLIDSNVALDAAMGNAPNFGIKTIAGKESEYMMDPNNPDNQGKLLSNESMRISNEIDKIKLANIPAEIKANLEILQQQVERGEIDGQTAEFQLNELLDPNSVTNRSRELGLEASRLGNEELRKRIDEIGKQPIVTEQEKRMQEIDLALAEEELKKAQGEGGGMSDKMLEESRGMVDAIRSGQLTAGAAYQQIEEDTKLGFYTPEEAMVLKSMLTEIAPSEPAPKLNEQQKETLNALPSDKVIKEEAKKMGLPEIDYTQWYKSPQGKQGGVDYATWHKLYGPRLGGGK